MPSARRSNLMSGNRFLPGSVPYDPTPLNSPAVHATGDQRSSVSPAEATLRVKGFARHLGVGVVGVAKMNPLWVSLRLTKAKSAVVLES